MPYESSFGELQSSGTPARASGENPFRLAILGDFSGRTQREPPAGRDELLARKPIKITFDSLDDVIESTAPRLDYTVADGDVQVQLDPTELDDFQPDPVYKNVDRLSDLQGEEAAALLREILHNPLYQGLESAWRGLEWFLRRVFKNGRIQVVLFDMTAEEFAADLTGGDDLQATAVYRQLIEKMAEGVDPQPWAVLIGNYTFDETTAHAEALGRMARIADRAGAPFLSAITPQVVQEGYEVPADGKDAWTALRKLPEAAYLGLAAPRFLLRSPFGENYRPAESLTFEEFAGSPNDYLWGNPALACAALLAEGFTKSGWGFQPAQFLSLGNMPMHSYRDGDGEPIAVTGEGRFTSKTSQGLVQRGFMPLLSVRGRDAIELACIRSMALEGGALAGCWVGGTPNKKASAVGGTQVGMMAGSSGVARQNREGQARSPAARRPIARLTPIWRRCWPILRRKNRRPRKRPKTMPAETPQADARLKSPLLRNSILNWPRSWAKHRPRKRRSKTLDWIRNWQPCWAIRLPKNHRRRSSPRRRVKKLIPIWPHCWPIRRRRIWKKHRRAEEPAAARGGRTLNPDLAAAAANLRSRRGPARRKRRRKSLRRQAKN